MRRGACIVVAALAATACSREAPEPAPSPTASAVTSAAPHEPALTADVTALPIPLVRFVGASAVDSAGTRLFLWGGSLGPGDAGARPEPVDPKLLEVVSLADAKYEPARLSGTPPDGVYVPAMVHDPYGKALYVFGGWAKGKKLPSNTLHRIETGGEGFVSRPIPKRGDWPSPRNGPAMAEDSVGNALLLFGGDGGPDKEQSFTPLDDLWRFDLEKQSWARVEASGDRPPARWHAAMAIDEPGRRAYLFGGAGIGADEHDARVYELGLATFTWSLVRATGDAPPSLQGATLTFDPEQKALVLVGGLRHVAPGPAVASEIWILDIEKKLWTRTDSKVARRDHAGGYDTSTRAHYALGGRISQTIGDFYEVGEPVPGALRIRVVRR